VSGQEVVVGSRGSALALAQARLVHVALDRVGRSIRIVVLQPQEIS
jgi:porphobilinogen deaminase